jgi:hypothetical protein
MMAAMSEKPPYWYLISVLFSTVPLTQALATSLYEVARSLYRSGESAGEVIQEGTEGRVKNLKKSFALGAISGPGFEAELDMPKGKGKVRFLLTREGLEHGKRRERLEASLRN